MQKGAPEPTTIGAAAKLVYAQHPTWTFQESWDYAEAVYPELRRSVSSEENIAASAAARHQELENLRIAARVEAVARSLMSKSQGQMTHREALERARQQLVEARCQTLVTAQVAVQFDGLPTAIQYFPAGRSTITPSVDGVPKTITVNVTPGTAATLQSDLTRLLSGNVRPYVDFDHAGGAAAALPRRFFWKDGKGVMLELDWTGAGRNAIGGWDYSYLSPTFMISKDGDAISLPPSGAIASLVNNPAFRNIARIAARA